jgi:uncharacterized protein (DUF1778 family)
MAAMRDHDARRHTTRPTPKRERFAARLSREQKELMQRAADLQGQTLTDFVVASAQQAAERAIRDHELIVLSARDSYAVMQALLHPEPAGAWLRQAAQRYKDFMGERETTA